MVLLRKILKWIGAVCAVIGAIDLPDQLQKWAKYIASLAGVVVNWDVDIPGNGGRWIFLFVGMVLILIAYEVPGKLLGLWRRHQNALPGGLIIECPDLVLTPSEGPSHDLRLAVMNGQSDGKFWATCKIIAVRNDLQARIGTYALKWLDTNEKERTIRRHDTENLLIARFHPIQVMEGGGRVNYVGKMDLLEWSVSGEKVFTSSIWIIPDTPPPEYDLEIRIFCENVQSPMIENYTVRPKSGMGPLEMIVHHLQTPMISD